MPIKRPPGPPGRLAVLPHTSTLLRGNPLGDPSVRPVNVWLPPQYDAAAFADRRFPVLFDLVGFMGSGPSHTHWKNFGENVPERAARLIHEKKMAPVIIVFPDCFTALGGNQYIDSSAIGPYASYLTRELIPFVDANFRTLASRAHRGCFGKSSARPKRVAGAVDVQALEAGIAAGEDDGRVAAFLKALHGKKKLGRSDGHTVMMLCMAASYDPDPEAPNGFRLPFNLVTGERIEARWKAWLAHDPIHLVRRHVEALRSLRGIYIDCGWADQYHIHYGARILSKRLAELGIAHAYEEFDDDHSDIDYRMDTSLPFLVRALSA